MKSLRGKIEDMDLDPVKLKKERDHWKHEQYNQRRVLYHSATTTS